VPEKGLRERKKQATRDALIAAARRLGADVGAQNARLEDIAAAAGVSPRTVGNYFSSKDEIILAIGAERATRVGEALRARPVDEPLWEALGHALRAEFAGAREVTRANLAAAQAGPRRAAALLQLQRAIEPALADAIADRTGTDAEFDLYPRLVAGAVIAVSRITVEFWRAADDPSLSLPDLLQQALRLLAEGLPVTPDGGPPWTMS
jgi:AcrR family transcriptional regulator